MGLISLIIVAILSAICSWVLGFGMRRWAQMRGWLDIPDQGRHRHAVPIPYGGGIVIWCVFFVGMAVVSCAWPALFQNISLFERIGFFLATIPLLFVGTLDDRHSLAARWLFLGVVMAIGLALAFGLRVEKLTHPFGGSVPLPMVVSFIISALWLLACTGATKFSDGLDGLVAGQTVIGSFLIAGLCLTPAFFQPDIALLAILFGGAFFGVLIHGWPRARLFLGEFGSTFAGFGLGVLALASGAKFAIALMAMGFFVADVVWVMLRRLARGRSPLEGDRTHLHFVLLAAGLPSWAVAVLLWVLALGFGLAALQLQTQAKLMLFAAVIVFTWGLSFFASQFAERRGVKIV